MNIAQKIIKTIACLFLGMFIMIYLGGAQSSPLYSLIKSGDIFLISFILIGGGTIFYLIYNIWGDKK